MGVFGNRAGDLAAVFLDEGFEVVAILREDAGDDESLASEGEGGAMRGRELCAQNHFH